MVNQECPEDDGDWPGRDEKESSLELVAGGIFVLVIGGVYSLAALPIVINKLIQEGRRIYHCNFRKERADRVEEPDSLLYSYRFRT